MAEGVTQRGFEIVKFEDAKEKFCSLQQSSAIGESDTPGDSFLWLGVHEQRMHLDREMVSGLIQRLQRWVDTGKILEERE